VAVKVMFSIAGSIASPSSVNITLTPFLSNAVNVEDAAAATKDSS